MDIFTLAIWILTAAFLVVSLVKDRAKTLDALKKALAMGRGMALSIFAVIFAIGLMLAIFPPDRIAQLIQGQNVFWATLLAAAFGTITLIPAFIAFPLIGTLAGAGMGMMPSVAFLTTLTMVGIATFPLEKRAFGLRFTLWRNGLSFVFALLIAVAMGGIL